MADPKTDPKTDEGARVLVGEFGRAHGVKGEVRLKSFTADPLAIASYAPLAGSDGKTYRLAQVRTAPGGAPDMLVARVEGVSGREAAERLTRVTLSIPRDRLPPPEDEDEFYLADLVGLRADDEAGRVLGRVVAVHNYGAGDILDIAPEGGGKSAMVPFTKAAVPVVDVKGGRIVLAYDPFAPSADEDEPETEGEPD